MPHDAKSMVIITEDAKIYISKDTQATLDWSKEIELKPKEETEILQPPH